MKLRHHFILEALLLTAVVALAAPYFLQAFELPDTFDCSYDRVRMIIEAAEPNAILLRGEGENGFSDITYAIPPNAVDFVRRVNNQMETQALVDHWSIHGSGKESESGEMTQFSYKLTKGKSQCSVRLIKVYQREADFHDGYFEVRFFLFVNQSEQP